jgi:hypothetical protein
VIAWHGDIVCYELPVAGAKSIPSGTNTGGGLQARRLGHEGFLEVTTELRAAIEADLRKHHGAK